MDLQKLNPRNNFFFIFITIFNPTKMLTSLVLRLYYKVINTLNLTLCSIYKLKGTICTLNGTLYLLLFTLCSTICMLYIFNASFYISIFMLYNYSINHFNIHRYINCMAFFTRKRLNLFINTIPVKFINSLNNVKCIYL